MGRPEGQSITSVMGGIKLNALYFPAWDRSVSTKLAWIFILTVGVVAIIGPLISNEKPYYCKLEGKNYYPLFSGVSESTLSTLHPTYSPVDWQTTNFESVWYPPVPYSHFTIDLKSGRHVSPFDKQDQRLRFRHWLGTDIIGRDVLAGLIRGCRISLLIGLGSMLLALLIGVPLGSIAAYWGNQNWRLSWLQMMIGSLFFLAILYFAWLPVSFPIKIIWILLIAVIGFAIFYLPRKRKKQTAIPLDHVVMGIISVIDSFPGLFIVLILLVIIPLKGWLVVMFAIALLRWPAMARYMRAEVYKMKESNYIKAAQVVNLPHSQILRHHIIPYAFRPVMISFIFGVSSAILAESSLSFLGIGLPVDELNWGRLLSQSRNHFDAWWLVLFPGSAIFFTLLSLYTLGNAARKSLDKIEELE
jgi:peptide/nickel transport system permease protein